MALSYAEKVRRSAERSRIEGRSGRDISPLPAIKDPMTRLACRDDLELFCTTYLPRWFVKPFGEPHIALLQSLQTILKDGGRKAVAMPRGSGKSTIVAASILWALLYGYRRYICVIGASSKASHKFVSLLSTTLATPHTPLSQDFPEACYPIQALGGSVVQARGQHYRGTLTRIGMTAEQLILPTIAASPSSGSRLVALGIGSAIRGQSAEAPDGTILRPDCVLLDDIQSDADSVSPARIEKLRGLVSGVIKGLARSGERLAQICTCTVVNVDDLADQMLADPLWNGLRTSALSSMPSNLDLWREYRDVLFERGEQEARSFYRENYAELTRGAVASWPADYDPAHYEDAIHYNMHLWSEDERSFWSERVNQPQRPSGLGTILSAPEIANKLSYISRGNAHEKTYKITAAVDVHDDILYYAVLSLQSDYTASVIDYGTYPRQSRPYFHRGSGIVTLQQVYGGEAASNVLRGLEHLIRYLSDQRYYIEGGHEHAIDRVLIDSGWRNEVVYEAIRRANFPVAVACKGVSIRACQRPMNDWSKKSGRVVGWHVVEERLQSGKTSVLCDVNYWKTRLQEALSTPPGKSGEMTLYGSDPSAHRMLADHLTAETPKVEELENTVVVWTQKPSAENHWLDCVCYAYAAGVTLGLRPSDCVV